MNIDKMIKEYRDKIEKGYQRSALTLLDGNIFSCYTAEYRYKIVDRKMRLKLWID